MATVIEGFLVSLGFDIDKDQLAKFNGAIETAGKRFVSIGKAAVGAGVAIGAAFAKSTQEINDLYKISNNTGASIKGIQMLQGAVERVGGSSESVATAFQDFALKAKTYGPAFEQMVGGLGVRLRQSNGQARDMADVFVDISKKLSNLAKVNPGIARMQAEAIGLGAIFDDIVKGDFPAELERSAKFARLFGNEIDAGANSSHRLMNEIGQVWDTIASGSMSAASQITEALQLDKKLAKFNDSFADYLKSVIDSQVSIIKEASGFFDWVGKILFKSGDYFDASRTKVLEGRVKSGKATKEEREELKTLKKEKIENDYADRMVIDRDEARRRGLYQKQDDDLALKAQIFGGDLNDPEVRKALANRQVTTEDLAGFSEEGRTTDVMIGAELMKRQKMNYFEQSVWSREVSNTSSIDNRNQATTINQTINISGSGNPNAVAQSVMDSTNALVKTRNRGIV